VRSGIVLGLLIAASCFAASLVAPAGASGLLADAGQALALFAGSGLVAVVAVVVAKVLRLDRQWTAPRSRWRKDPRETIADFVEYARVAQKQGMLAVESITRAGTDPLIANGFQMVADGARPAEIRAALGARIDDATGARTGRRIVRLLPAFAAGALVPCLLLLSGRFGDPLAAGTAWLFMAFAGCMAAMLACTASTVKGQSGRVDPSELLGQAVIVEGLVAIRNGEGPDEVERTLTALLPTGSRAVPSRAKAA
jgi:chemotaxis protein MotA